MTNSTHNRQMVPENIWAIRDSRNLSAMEKVFLFTVESRGAMTTSWRRAAADMGMSKTTFYEVRNDLLEKGLIGILNEGRNGSVCVVNSALLRDWCELGDHSASRNDSATRNEDSASRNELSATRNEDSATRNRSKNKKKTNKNTTEEGGLHSASRNVVNLEDYR